MMKQPCLQWKLRKIDKALEEMCVMNIRAEVSLLLSCVFINFISHNHENTFIKVENSIHTNSVANCAYEEKQNNPKNLEKTR